MFALGFCATATFASVGAVCERYEHSKYSQHEKTCNSALRFGHSLKRPQEKLTSTVEVYISIAAPVSIHRRINFCTRRQFIGFLDHLENYLQLYFT